MNIKKVDDKPMEIHTKEKTRFHVKGSPETKIKGRNILTVQRGPKIAGSVEEKSVAADGKTKLKISSALTDKRKKAQTKTAACDMEYRGETDLLHRAEKGMELYKAGAAAKPHREEMKAEVRRADRGKNRK